MNDISEEIDDDDDYPLILSLPYLRFSFLTPYLLHACLLFCLHFPLNSYLRSLSLLLSMSNVVCRLEYQLPRKAQKGYFVSLRSILRTGVLPPRRGVFRFLYLSFLSIYSTDDGFLFGRDS